MLFAQSEASRSRDEPPARRDSTQATPTGMQEVACQPTAAEDAGTVPPRPLHIAAPPRPASHPPNDEDECVAELVAEQLIAGAKSDSLLTNPAMAIANMIDYVQEWRDAFDVVTGGSTPSRSGPAAPHLRAVTQAVCSQPSSSHGGSQTAAYGAQVDSCSGAQGSSSNHASIKETSAQARERKSTLLYAS